MAIDFRGLSHHFVNWIDLPGYPLPHAIPQEEYLLRVARARAEMARADLDALVITSSQIGNWFMGGLEPHEWHDLCPARAAWYILTAADDILFMTPTGGGEHFNTTRRSTWVSQIRGVVERFDWPRHEIWDLKQFPLFLEDLGLARARLGFELGDCMTLGMSVNDFLRLRTLLPEAAFVDASPALRRLMSIHTPLEIERTRRACQAGVWIHNRLPEIVRPGMSERQLATQFAAAFAKQFGEGYEYSGEGGWDVRNPNRNDANVYHAVMTDRAYSAGDMICRGLSGVSFQGYGGDVDRMWYIGEPPEVVQKWYRIAWECNRAMAEQIRPGNLCSEIFRAYSEAVERNGLPSRVVGRAGHGIRNTGGLSVHADCHLPLEPGMIISVEPMLASEYGWFDLEDQYVVTETGAECLHELAPEKMPIITAE